MNKSVPETHKHLMIDIETMGEAIMTVGAVPFSIHPERMEVASIAYSFHGKVPLRESVNAGMAIDPDTVEWWLGQERATQQALLTGYRYTSLEALCHGFLDYCRGNLGSLTKLTLWAKPPEFDIVTLRKAFNLCEVEWPFHFGKSRDMMTLLEVAKFRGGMEDVMLIQPMTKHNAVEDAQAQAAQVVAIMSGLLK